VAAARRLLRERRVGHTGTLDPLATGVLPLVVGKATRLARFFSASRKTYDAVIALGVDTDTFDSQGTAVGGVRREHPAAPLPGRDAVEAALAAFRGTFAQVPPRYSAKKVGGVASHRLARKGTAPVTLAPVEVTVESVEITAEDAGRVALRLTVSAGFYVRSLAHDLGVALGCGAHLAELRRTSSGVFSLDAAVPLEDLDLVTARARLVPLHRLLPEAPVVVLDADTVRRVLHGQAVGPAGVRREGVEAAPWGGGVVRMLDTTGTLVALAEPGPAAPCWPLHPSVVLA
jgi:tRNA pseudouridine55 synthase